MDLYPFSLAPAYIQCNRQQPYLGPLYQESVGIGPDSYFTGIPQAITPRMMADDKDRTRLMNLANGIKDPSEIINLAERVHTYITSAESRKTKNGNDGIKRKHGGKYIMVNIRQLMRRLRGEEIQCPLDEETVKNHCLALWSEETEELTVPTCDYGPADKAGTQDLMKPFTQKELLRCVRVKTPAHGTDGLTYEDLNKKDQDMSLCTALFNACLRLNCIPLAWKTFQGKLVHKRDTPKEMKNWRIVSMSNTYIKLLAALLAYRLKAWAVANNRISPAQQGYLYWDGYRENGFILEEIIADSCTNGKEVAIAWLDISNACASLPHTVIRQVLTNVGVSEAFLNIWEVLNVGITTEVRWCPEGRTVSTGPMSVHRGLREGCPMTHVIIALVIETLHRALAKSTAGYTLRGIRFNVFSYLDKFALVADTQQGLHELLTSMDRVATSMGFQFNRAKGQTLHISDTGREVLPSEFYIQGTMLKPKQAKDPYMYTNIPLGFQLPPGPARELTKLKADMKALDEAKRLRAYDKQTALTANILPGLYYRFRGIYPEKEQLLEINEFYIKVAKSWLGLPEQTLDEMVYIEGVLPLPDLVDILTVDYALRLLTAKDEKIKHVARESLKETVEKRLQKSCAPTNEELAEYLSGKFEDDEESSLWAWTGACVLNQRGKLGFEWIWPNDSNGPTLNYVHVTKKQRNVISVISTERSKVFNDMRMKLCKFYEHHLYENRKSGKPEE